jgi:spoIIIJ-associated protein
MKFITRESNTIENAVSEGLVELKADINEVEIEIIQEPSRSFLGLISKKAKVKLTVVDGPNEKAKGFLDTLLKKMDVDCKYEIKFENEVLNVDIYEINDKDKGIMIGKRGKNLDSLQYILSLIINKGRQTYVRTLVDVENYRSKREETLVKLAERMADKTRFYKKKIKLEPMNPYERRIIHSALQDKEDIITYSEGEEPYRKVIIDLK